jgi:hypothetical protein
MSEYNDDEYENMGESLEDDIDDNSDDLLDMSEEDEQIELTEEEALLKADEMCVQNALYDFYVSEMSK